MELVIELVTTLMGVVTVFICGLVLGKSGNWVVGTDVGVFQNDCERNS